MGLPVNLSNSTLYPNLSYKEFFDTYNPFVDGQAYIATYSFNHSNFDFWAKLEPLSILYIDKKYERAGLSFLRRFPLFEVYSVPNLHTKAVLFCDSSRFLLGSENLYAPESSFSELMLEATIPEEQKNELINFAFRSLEGKILTCQYSLKDLRITPDGLPYLPCEKEVSYWDLIVNRITLSGKPPDPELHSPSYIYHIKEYCVGNKSHVLAFNRGYVYCGDISIDCFKWLIENCKITQKIAEPSISTATDLVESSPRKDYFMNYHPIASKYRAQRSYWLGKVKNLAEHKELIEEIKLHVITDRKIRQPR